MMDQSWNQKIWFGSFSK